MSTLVTMRSTRLTGGDGARVGQDEGHPDRLLVHEPLVEPAVVAEEEALVGGVDDHRVVELPEALEPLSQASDVVVDRGDAGEVVLHVALVLPQRLLVGRETLWHRLLEVLRGQVVGDPHRRAPRRVGATREVVGEGRGHRDRRPSESPALRIQPLVRSVRLPRSVRRLVPDEDAPRAVTHQRLDPLDRQVGDDLGGVARLDAEPVGSEQLRVVVLALVDERLPPVEALGVVRDPVARALPHVPLADEGRAVAGLAQGRDEGRLRRVDRGVEGRDAVDVAVGAGEDR
ncbi:MAG: hypothetical protein JWP82_2813, partial [Humibacillus sp.]|nr:hypothetical protein [Humibacillus sp.]